MTAAAETWFDTRDGALLIGEAAIEQRLIEAGSAVVPLQELLLTKDFPFDHNDFTKLDKSDMDKDAYLQFGEWALRIIQPSEAIEPIRPLTSNIINRLHILGLGPTRQSITRNSGFPTVRSYQERIGSPESDFTNWPFSPYLEITRAIYRRTKCKPKVTDYDVEARIQRVPGRTQITLKFGTPEYLNEVLGYPVYDLWETKDYAEWGAQAQAANPTRGLSEDLFEALSAVDKGPSVNKIYAKFGSLPAFYEAVQEHIVCRNRIPTISHEEFRERLYTRFDTSDAIFVAGFEDLSYQQQLEFFGVFLVAKHTLGDAFAASAVAYGHIQNADAFEYLWELKKRKPDISLAKVMILSQEFGTPYPKPIWELSKRFLQIA